MKILPLLTCMCLLLFGACKPTPETVLDEKAMAYLLSDLEMANAMSESQSLGAFHNDSLRLALRSSVLAKHGINEATLDSCLRWYGAHLPEYMKVIDLADSILSDTLQAFITNENTKIKLAAGDSLNMWPHAPSAVFARTQPTDFITFEIAADSTWKRGDMFTLRMASDNTMSELKATLVVDYQNRQHTTDAVTSILNPGNKRRLEVKLQLDSNISAQRIYGYIQLSPKQGERAFIDSIKLMRTRLVVTDYNKYRRQTHRITRNER